MIHPHPGNDIDGEAALAAYLFGELSPEGRAEMERRLALSAPLRAELEELRAALATTQALARAEDLRPVLRRESVDQLRSRLGIAPAAGAEVIALHPDAGDDTPEKAFALRHPRAARALRLLYLAGGASAAASFVIAFLLGPMAREKNHPEPPITASAARQRASEAHKAESSRRAVELWGGAPNFQPPALPSEIAKSAPENSDKDEERVGSGVATGAAADADLRSLPPRREIAYAPPPPRRYIEEEPPKPVPSPVEPGGRTFQDHGVNPFVETRGDRLSTFAVDVDTASYSVVRDFLKRGELPPAAAVRVEEVVNYFPDRYPPPLGEDFAVHGQMAPSPFGKGVQLRRAGIKARTVAGEARKPLVLTLVVDVSGSMNERGKIELVKRALSTLVGRLRPQDRLGVVTFNRAARELLPHVAGSETDRIQEAISFLSPDGGTNVAEGLQVGYAAARRAFNAEAVNRVVLLSDGVANEGLTQPEAMLGQVAQYARDNIYLTAVGVGLGEYNDALLEALADKGNGHYVHMDGDAEARRAIDRDLIGGAEVIAQDAKTQIDFNPAAVRQWRQLGYENRAVAAKDFRNDAVDAGEIGAGHAVTALYELELEPGAETDEIATVSVRYKQPGKAMAPREVKGALARSRVARTFEATDDQFKLAAFAAEFAEILRNSYWARGSRPADVAKAFDAAFPANPPCPEAGELRGLLDVADHLAATRPAPDPPRGAPTTDAPGGKPGAGGTGAIKMEEQPR